MSRSLYIAANGIGVERKYIYATPDNWDDLYGLAHTIGLPVGKMLVMLAYAEIDRIRQSRYIAPTLRHASHR